MNRNYSYGLNVKLFDSLLDRKLFELFETCKGDVSKMDDIAKAFHDKAWNPLTARLLDFIFSYQDGLLAPEKWGFDDPPRNKVDENTKERLIQLISRPCESIVLKRLSKPKIDIIIHSDYPMLRPTRGYYAWGGRRLPSISFWFDRRQSFSLDQWIPLLNDLCKTMGTDYGYIYEYDEFALGIHRVLADTFMTPYHKHVGREKNEILGSRRMRDIIKDYLACDYPIAGIGAEEYYPSICESVSPVEIGLYAYSLMLDMLQLFAPLSLKTALLFHLRPGFVDLDSFSWNNPTCFWYSSVYLSRADIVHSFEHNFNIEELPSKHYPLFDGFNKAFCLGEKEGNFKSILLLP